MVKKNNKMKNTIFYLLVSMALLIMSCEEDNNRGQFSVDSIPPGKVTDISVQNEKGFSVLTYKNPTDKDLLYVEAKYTNSLGNEAIVRASAFSNTMKLNGFLRSTKIPVKVFAVDKSLNISEITAVEIEPLDNTIFDVFASLNYQAVFGGVKLSWDNETEQELVFEFLTFDEGSNIYNDFKSIYSKSSSLGSTIRGLEAVESKYGVLIRDEFGQRTDTLKFTAKPFFEEEISPVKFRELPHNPDFNTTSFSTGFGSIFDGNPGGSYSTFGSGIGKVYFTMDLGEEIKLSRFKMWTRNDFIYAHSQPKHIVLLGTNDQTLANDPLSEVGWDTIGEWVDEKPSGNGPNESSTDEDVAHFNSGIDFEIDIAITSYRYLRFVTLETWGKTDRMWIAELRYWGQRIN